ncbi:MAG: RimK family alpha-L-glutamate ligase, partial [Oligoflexales bacterium]|nr:RimK family alpha-L-glutamate ligase [Oligoflexales bacterium]
VIDDPESILRCTNKVYLAELLIHHHIPAPRTYIIHKNEINSVIDKLPVPCVLKKPDSSFSLGVVKVETREEMQQKITEILNETDLMIAQEFMPTSFDWRIGIINSRIIYACKYYMARGHWQIYNRERGSDAFGPAEAVPIESLPQKLRQLAIRTSSIIGDGLYGLDIKEVNGKFYVIEVNDNPSIEAGCEDKIVKNALYENIMGVFLERLDRKTKGHLI